MTKEQFIKRINLIQNFHSEQETLSDLIDKLTNSNSIVEFGDELVFEMIDMISENVNLSKDDDLLSWWLYETDNRILYEGKDCEIKIDIKTPEQLYNYIVNNYNKKEEI